MRPEIRLVRRRGELEFLPDGQRGQPRGEAADGGEAGQRLMDEIGGNLPGHQRQIERAGKIEGPAGEDVAGGAGNGEGEVVEG